MLPTPCQAHWARALNETLSGLPYNALRIYNVDPSRSYARFLAATAARGVYVLAPVTPAASPYYYNWAQGECFAKKNGKDHTRVLEGGGRCNVQANYASAACDAPAEPNGTRNAEVLLSSGSYEREEANCYPPCLLSYGEAIIKMFAPHEHTLAFVVGNEVLQHSVMAAPCVRQYALDLKRYMRRCRATSRQVLLAYAGADAGAPRASGMLPWLDGPDTAWEQQLITSSPCVYQNPVSETNRAKARFLACADGDGGIAGWSDDTGVRPIDIFALNYYRWCHYPDNDLNGDSSVHVQDLKCALDRIADAPVAVMLGEYGCAVVRTDENHPLHAGFWGGRPWTEVPRLYTAPISDTLSGGFAYAYGQASIDEASGYAMVAGGSRAFYCPDGSAVNENCSPGFAPTDDFQNFEEQLGLAAPPNETWPRACNWQPAGSVDESSLDSCATLAAELATFESATAELQYPTYSRVGRTGPPQPYMPPHEQTECPADVHVPTDAEACELPTASPPPPPAPPSPPLRPPSGGVLRTVVHIVARALNATAFGLDGVNAIAANAVKSVVQPFAAVTENISQAIGADTSDYKLSVYINVTSTVELNVACDSLKEGVLADARAAAASAASVAPSLLHAYLVSGVAGANTCDLAAMTAVVCAHYEGLVPVENACSPDEVAVATQSALIAAVPANVSVQARPSRSYAQVWSVAVAMVSQPVVAWNGSHVATLEAVLLQAARSIGPPAAVAGQAPYALLVENRVNAPPVEWVQMKFEAAGQGRLLKAIAYSPVPLGRASGANFLAREYSAMYVRDLRAIAASGANAIRVYLDVASAAMADGNPAMTDISHFLDEADAAGLGVIMSVVGEGEAADYHSGADDWLQELISEVPYPPGADADKQRAAGLVRLAVRRYGPHPAVIAWVIGNELNGGWKSLLSDSEAVRKRHGFSVADDFFDWLEEIASAIKDEYNRTATNASAIVTTCFADVVPSWVANQWESSDAIQYRCRAPDSQCKRGQEVGDDCRDVPPSCGDISKEKPCGELFLERAAARMPHMDALSYNLYRGLSSSTFYSNYSCAVKEGAQQARTYAPPLMVLEYGIDSFDMQAYNVSLASYAAETAFDATLFNSTIEANISLAAVAAQLNLPTEIVAETLGAPCTAARGTAERGDRRSYYSRGSAPFRCTPGAAAGEFLQSNFAIALSEEIMAYSMGCDDAAGSLAGDGREIECAAVDAQVLLGGAIMSFMDEWWKGSSPTEKHDPVLNPELCNAAGAYCEREADGVTFKSYRSVLNTCGEGGEDLCCPDVDARRQGLCGRFTGYGQPDRYVNEEHFGLFAALPAPHGLGADVLYPKPAFRHLCALWGGGAFCEAERASVTGDDGSQMCLWDARSMSCDAEAELEYERCAEQAAEAANCTAVEEGWCAEYRPDCPQCEAFAAACAREFSCSQGTNCAWKYAGKLCSQCHAELAAEAEFSDGARACIAAAADEARCAQAAAEAHNACIVEAACSQAAQFLSRREAAGGSPAEERSERRVMPEGERRIGRVALLPDSEQVVHARGVVYFPVPAGQDPAYDEPFGDYYTEYFRRTWMRDMRLMAELGANMLWLRPWSRLASHEAFLDEASARGLQVVASFWGESPTAGAGTGAASHAWVRTDEVHSAEGRARIVFGLERLLDEPESVHRAISMWAIGPPEGLNAPWEGYGAEASGGDLSAALNVWLLVDELCAAVQRRGQLCAVPLANVPVPDRFISRGYESALGWVQALRPLCPHVDLWAPRLLDMANSFGDFFVHYAGRDALINIAPFRPAWQRGDTSTATWRWGDVAPLLVAAYGADAYNTQALAVGALDENDEGGQATRIAKLARELSDNFANHDSGAEAVAAGGFLYEWSDEWWRGRQYIWSASRPGSDASVDERVRHLCSQQSVVDATHHSVCGLTMPGATDGMANVEWYGLVSLAAADDSRTPASPDRPPQFDDPTFFDVVPRVAYATMQLMWAPEATMEGIGNAGAGAGGVNTAQAGAASAAVFGGILVAWLGARYYWKLTHQRNRRMIESAAWREAAEVLLCIRPRGRGWDKHADLEGGADEKLRDPSQGLRLRGGMWARGSSQPLGTAPPAAPTASDARAILLADAVSAGDGVAALGALPRTPTTTRRAPPPLESSRQLRAPGVPVSPLTCPPDLQVRDMRRSMSEMSTGSSNQSRMSRFSASAGIVLERIRGGMGTSAVEGMTDNDEDLHSWRRHARGSLMMGADDVMAFDSEQTKSDDYTVETVNPLRDGANMPPG